MAGGDYSALTPVVPGAVTEQWGLDVRDSVVLRFASAAARSAALAALGAGDEGMVSYLKDTNTLQVWDGTNWVSPASLKLGSSTWTSQTSATTTETIVSGSSTTVTMLAGRRYLVTVSSMYSSNTAGDNVALRLRHAAGASVTNTGTLAYDVTGTSAGNYVVPATFSYEASGIAAGQRTWGLFVVRYGGSGTVSAGNAVNSNNSLIITDIGV